MDSRGVGQKGEDLAEDYLRREKNFRILARNWREGPREIDLIAWDGPVMVVVEVKTRRRETPVPPRVAVNRAKKAALRKAVYAFLRTLRQRTRAVRFDVVEVLLEPLEGTDPVVRHYENISLFSVHFRPS